MNRWFDIPDLPTPFLAINLTNRTKSSQQTNAELLPKRKTGHWPLTRAVLDSGIEGRPVVLFYSRKGIRTLYVGTCVSKKQTDWTRDGRPRYTLTVAQGWENVGTVDADVSFSHFFMGFALNTAPTVLWADMERYTPPDGEKIALEGDNGGGEDPNGKGGLDEPTMGSRRVRHELFVLRLTKIWGKRCALTDLQAPRLVQACHLVPWSAATPAERVSGHNGLMLCAHLHALLDSHLLGFDDDGHLMLAEDIDADVRALVLAGTARRLRKKLPVGLPDFLRRHREAAIADGRHLVRV